MAGTGTLYASVQDLSLALAGTDQGIGSPSQLTSDQLNLALYRASNTVSVYAGNVFDSSSAQAIPPAIFHDLTLDLAVFYAWRIYLKGKTVPPDHPARIVYNEAIQMLKDVRDGKLRLDVAVAGAIGEETGVVINRIPPVFDGNDSNTRLSPLTGGLESDVPAGLWAPQGIDPFEAGYYGGPVYQG